MARSVIPSAAHRLQLLLALACSPLLSAWFALPALADPVEPDPIPTGRPRWELLPPLPPLEPQPTSLVWTAADDGSDATATDTASGRKLDWVAVEPGDTDPVTPFSYALASIASDSSTALALEAAEPDNTPKTAAEALALARSLPPPPESYGRLLRLGQALPTANQLEAEGLQLSAGLIAPSGGAGEDLNGTGTQNSYGRLDLGLTQRLQLSGFISVSPEDALFAPISNKRVQPANRWEVIGGAAQWQLASGERWALAITGSIEQFTVESGGSGSSNIFNDTNQLVSTANVVGSIGLPFSWQLNRTLQLSFTPGASFLPATQGGGQGGASTFYGTSFSLAAGLNWRPAPQLNLFASGLLPLGPGTNSFDRNLDYGRVPIYTAGLNYALNPRIGLEGAITNGFGASPATALLALPSQEQLLYTGRLVYSIQAEDSPPLAMSRRQKSLATGGVTVNTALVPAEASVQISANADSLGNLFGFLGYSVSNDVQLQLWSGGAFNGIDPVTSLSSAFAPDNELVQNFGGKGVLFSQLRGAPFSGGGRISVGTQPGNTCQASCQGYLFFEAMATWEGTSWLAVNANPKLVWNGTSNAYGLGLSANVQLGRWFQFIPELNLVAEEDTNSTGTNGTAALRWVPNDSAMLDVYVSNAAGLLDIGQLLGNSQVRVGGRLTLLF
jgi:hypothetical protein